ncbi:hypothetical protein X801_02034 [Opisthorchis viverrini]|uniref:Uncharacterized protein n=1 Tax=Opisthorchis viverrini TaxID=6198 RepID=A0A1S8X5X2_OPIVI|nr:hypothetical protein X801_02034 [Opisthorchis viverrini]
MQITRATMWLTRTLQQLSPKAKTLMQEMLSEANKFRDYNFRVYFTRKIKNSFSEIEAATNISDIDRLMEENVKLLGILRRQTTLNNFFPPNKSAIE